ncbi:flagellar hook-basal body protein [Candidatus Margulisiibacteriota bacterium]
MITQLHVAKTTLHVLERKLAVITNNISNGETPGFKSMRVEMETMPPLAFSRTTTEFEEAGGLGSNKRTRYMEYGNGVKISAITRNFNPGTIEITNNPMDFAVTNGPGLFQFRLPDGTLAYSRAGNLHQDFEGNLVNPVGQPLDPPIRVPQYTNQIMVNEEGRVFAQVANESVPREIGQVMLCYFQNPAGLRDVGNNLLVETAASGEPSLEHPGRNGIGDIQQGALEFSNVNVIEEMMQMLLVQRLFEVAVKAVNANDNILKKGQGIGG